MKPFDIQDDEADRIRAALVELDTLDDKISEQISAIGDALLSLGLYTTVGVEVSRDETKCSTTMLVFDKHNGTWQFVMMTGGPFNWDVTPLRDCPRDERATALAKRIPHLYSTIVSALRKKHAERRVALDAGDKILAHVFAQLAGDDNAS